MSMKEAQTIIKEYALETNEDTIEIVLEVIHKYQTARAVLIEGLKPQYKYLKKLSKLLAMLDEKNSYDIEAENISQLLHNIHRTVLIDSQKKDESFLELLRRINIRKTFNPSEMQIWVMQYLGGRNLISDINLQDANQLNRRILNAIEKYFSLPDSKSNLAIQNNSFNNLVVKRY